VAFGDPRLLTLGLLNHLQDWLRNEYRNWRILIQTTGNIDETILVYPKRIRISEELEVDLEQAVAKISAAMPIHVEPK